MPLAFRQLTFSQMENITMIDRYTPHVHTEVERSSINYWPISELEPSQWICQGPIQSLWPQQQFAHPCSAVYTQAYKHQPLQLVRSLFPVSSSMWRTPGDHTAHTVLLAWWPSQPGEQYPEQNQIFSYQDHNHQIKWLQHIQSKITKSNQGLSGYW